MRYRFENRRSWRKLFHLARNQREEIMLIKQLFPGGGQSRKAGFIEIVVQHLFNLSDSGGVISYVEINHRA